MSTLRGKTDALVTIGDLIDDRSLSITPAVLPDGGSERRVSWVHATERVDPRPHLRRHELVCTLGSALVRGRAAEAFVAALTAADVAGVALGLGEVHLGPPVELVAACEAAALPLLLLDHGVPFLAVNDTVLRRRSQIESEVRRTETSLLSQLMSMARDGEGEQSLLDRAEEVLGGRLRREESGSDRGLVWANGYEAATPEFVEQLQSLLEFSGRELEREASEQQQRLGQLLDLIAGGLALPAAILPEVQAQELDADDLRVSSWPIGSEGTLSRQGITGLIGASSHAVVLISEPRSEQSLRSVGLVCGYSSVVRLGELRRALNESRSALRLARSRGGVAGPDQLVSFDALLEQQPSEQLRPFVEHLLGPILEADDGRGDLIGTLRTFVGSGCRVQETSERLFVHVNTVRHRLKRIRELSGRDPLEADGIVDLRIALWAIDRRQALRHRLIRPLSQ